MHCVRTPSFAWSRCVHCGMTKTFRYIETKIIRSCPQTNTRICWIDLQHITDIVLNVFSRNTRNIVSLNISLVLLTAYGHLPAASPSQFNNHEVNGKRVVIILDLEILGYTEDRIVIEAEVKCVYSS